MVTETLLIYFLIHIIQYNNSVPFDTDDMLCIKSSIDHRLQNTRCSGYVITSADVRIAVDHRKYGKLDGLKSYALIILTMVQKDYMCFYLL